GPQFLSGLRRDAKHFIVLALLVPFLSAGLMLGVKKVFDLQPGFTSGIFAGANTAKPGLGAAKDAYNGGAVKLPQGVKAADAVGNLSTAFAFGYSISMVCFILLMKVLPKLFGKDAAAEAKAYQKAIEAGGSTALPGSAEALQHGALPVDVRVFQLEN